MKKNKPIPKNPFRDAPKRPSGFKKTKENPFETKKSEIDYRQKEFTRRGTRRKGGYVGGKRDRAKLSWSLDSYTPVALKKRDVKELRKEYSRLRSIARKRLERFDKSKEEGYRRTKLYQTYRNVFLPLNKIRDEKELRFLLTEVANFLTKQTSSIKGIDMQRDNFLKTMNRDDSPYKGIVNEKNYWDFIDFMDSLEKAGLKKMYDSKRLVEWFDSLKDITQYKDAAASELKKAFEEWGKKNIENFTVYKNPNAVGSNFFS